MADSTEQDGQDVTAEQAEHDGATAPVEADASADETTTAVTTEVAEPVADEALAIDDVDAQAESMSDDTADDAVDTEEITASDELEEETVVESIVETVADETDGDAQVSSEEVAAGESDIDQPVDEAAADAVLANDAELSAALEPGMEEISEEDLRRPIAELKAIVEAMIFASPEPLTPKALLKLLDTEPKEDVLAALEELKIEYQRPAGLQLVEVAGGFQIVTRADLHEWVRRLFHERSSAKLSAQALESLAVIAYRQPITAMEVAEIRGVNASGVLNTLLERHLIKIVGRKQVVGRPFMYATTREFLIRFGLKDLSDLPKVEDMAESLGIESSLLVEQTPPEEQLPLSEPDHAPVDEAVDLPDDFDSPDEPLSE